MIYSNIYARILRELEEGKRCVVLTALGKRTDPKPIPEKKYFGEDILQNSAHLPNGDQFLDEKMRLVLQSGTAQLCTDPDGERYLLEPYYPEPRLVIFGGGHIARPLAEFGAKVGFSVTVVDDRLSFAHRDRFPWAENVLCESFENSFNILHLNRASFVVIVTRGHRHDFYCLKEVLKYHTAYTGMIGSQRRVRIVKELLLQEGYSQEMLDRVNAPIGLKIGAVTPEEIAISIIAEVIRFRRESTSMTGSSKIHQRNWPELDREVLAELSSKDQYSRAIVTVVSTRGSVPRKAGAKMLVWPHGRILGSIGGGCSEGEVIVAARDIISTEGSRVQKIDLTGSIAEDEGMVCGGIMEVAIEYYGDK